MLSRLLFTTRASCTRTHPTLPLCVRSLSTSPSSLLPSPSSPYSAVAVGSWTSRLVEQVSLNKPTLAFMPAEDHKANHSKDTSGQSPPPPPYPPSTPPTSSPRALRPFELTRRADITTTPLSAPSRYSVLCTMLAGLTSTRANVTSLARFRLSQPKPSPARPSSQPGQHRKPTSGSTLTTGLPPSPSKLPPSLK